MITMSLILFVLQHHIGFNFSCLGLWRQRGMLCGQVIFTAQISYQISCCLIIFLGQFNGWLESSRFMQNINSLIYTRSICPHRVFSSHVFPKNQALCKNKQGVFLDRIVPTRVLRDQIYQSSGCDKPAKSCFLYALLDFENFH